MAIVAALLAERYGMPHTVIVFFIVVVFMLVITMDDDNNANPNMNTP